MILSGHRWSGSKDEYVYTGKVIAGSDTINTAISLLMPYTHESNLISVKDEKEFGKQLY